MKVSVNAIPVGNLLEAILFKCFASIPRGKHIRVCIFSVSDTGFQNCTWVFPQKYETFFNKCCYKSQIKAL
jgi:hypothetical protein